MAGPRPPANGPGPGRQPRGTQAVPGWTGPDDRAMLPAMERCGECGFEYDEAAAPEAAAVIGDGAAGLAAILRRRQAGPGSRREPGRRSPLEYACHVRDMLLVQRERLLAARRVERPLAEPTGRDERVELDGYAGQHLADVARQLGDAAQLFASCAHDPQLGLPVIIRAGLGGDQAFVDLNGLTGIRRSPSELLPVRV